MGALSFFIRTFFLTIALILVLQIRWGDASLEDITMNFVTSSAIVSPLNQTAQGAVHFIRNMWTKANRTFDTHFSQALQDENRPGSRHLGLVINRSEKAIKQKTEDVKEAAEGAFVEAKDSSAFQKFKDSARSASNRIRSKFVDETNVPSETNSPADHVKTPQTKTE
jgi:hypothetical protein